LERCMFRTELLSITSIDSAEKSFLWKPTHFFGHVPNTNSQKKGPSIHQQRNQSMKPNPHTMELQGLQIVLYVTGFGDRNLQRTFSQKSALTCYRNNYSLNIIATSHEPYRSIQNTVNVVANMKRLCFSDSKVKEMCRLGCMKHLVDLLDHRVMEIQKNTLQKKSQNQASRGRRRKKEDSMKGSMGGVDPVPGLLKSSKGIEMLCGSLVQKVTTQSIWNSLLDIFRISEEVYLNDYVSGYSHKELVDKISIRVLVNQVPGDTGPSVWSDEAMMVIFCALHE
ncbi:Plakophilin-4, partial [Galemys pyrenaicus]